MIGIVIVRSVWVWFQLIQNREQPGQGIALEADDADLAELEAAE